MKTSANNPIGDVNNTLNYGDEYYIGDPPGWLNGYSSPQPKTRSVKRTTRTVEKFDPEGQLISREVITEEEEIYDKQVWDSNEFIITGEGGTTGGHEDGNHCLTDESITSGSVTYKNDVPYTLTNGMGISNIVANYDSPVFGEE